MGFDPNAYLAKKQAFNPTAYLAKKKQTTYDDLGPKLTPEQISQKEQTFGTLSAVDDPSLLETGKGFVTGFVPNAIDTIKGIGESFGPVDPDRELSHVETLQKYNPLTAGAFAVKESKLFQSLKSLVKGTFQKLDMDEEKIGADEGAVDSLLRSYLAKYGGYENLKRTIRDKPAEFSLDLIGALSATGAGAKALYPGTNIAKTASATNPANFLKQLQKSKTFGKLKETVATSKAKVLTKVSSKVKGVKKTLADFFPRKKGVFEKKPYLKKKIEGGKSEIPKLGDTPEEMTAIARNTREKFKKDLYDDWEMTIDEIQAVDPKLKVDVTDNVVNWVKDLTRDGLIDSNKLLNLTDRFPVLKKLKLDLFDDATKSFEAIELSLPDLNKLTKELSASIKQSIKTARITGKSAEYLPNDVRLYRLIKSMKDKAKTTYGEPLEKLFADYGSNINAYKRLNKYMTNEKIDNFILKDSLKPNIRRDVAKVYGEKTRANFQTYRDLKANIEVQKTRVAAIDATRADVKLHLQKGRFAQRKFERAELLKNIAHEENILKSLGKTIVKSNFMKGAGAVAGGRLVWDLFTD